MKTPTFFIHRSIQTSFSMLGLFAILIAASSFVAIGQPAPIKQWDLRFGGTGNDGITSLEQTTDGGYILGGNSNSGISGDKTQTCQGSLFYDDYWMVKTDANGVKQWDARFGGDGSDDLWSIHQTTDGGYILGGTSTSVV